jgi:hypothetical protein
MTKIKDFENDTPFLIGILVLSNIDILLTLLIISLGGIEVNPIMDYYLNLGINHFILAKNIMTLSCLALYEIAKNRAILYGVRHDGFFGISVHEIPRAAALFYSILIPYELLIIAKIHGISLI